MACENGVNCSARGKMPSLPVFIGCDAIALSVVLGKPSFLEKVAGGFENLCVVPVTSSSFFEEENMSNKQLNLRGLVLPPTMQYTLNMALILK